MRVLIVAGGWSNEREISLLGAKQIAKALLELGHEVTQYDLNSHIETLLPLAEQHEVAFINLHGAPGEDGLVQALLDSAGCPYQGSGPAGSFLALHKVASKVLFRKAGLQTPDWQFLPERPGPNWTPPSTFPLFVKSNTGGSSLLLFKVNNTTELLESINSLFMGGHEVLIETCVTGQDVTCGVLGDKALDPILIVPTKSDFFNFHEKYAADGAKELCPAPLDPAINQKIQEMSLLAHSTLGLADYSRSDFILRQDGELFLLEVNTLPGMTPASLVPKEAAAIGLSFGELVEQLLHMALKRGKRS